MNFRKENEMKSKWKNKNFFEALKNSSNGIVHAVKEQKNLKIQLFITLIVVIFSIVLQINKIESLFICMSISFVIFAEVFNTAIEKTVDLVTEEYNEKAKIAKDIAAGAVTIASINAVIVGIIVFLEKIIKIVG